MTQQWEYNEIYFLRVQCTRTRMRTCTAWWGAPRRSCWSLPRTPPLFLTVSSGIIIISLMNWFIMFVLYLNFLFTINTFVLKYDVFSYRNVSSCEVYRERWRVSDWGRPWNGRGRYRVIHGVYITICIYVGYWARNSSYMIAYCLKTIRQTNSNK